MPAKQIWKCPQCGRTVEAPLPYQSVACDATHNGKYTEVQMRLVEGNPAREPGRRKRPTVRLTRLATPDA